MNGTDGTSRAIEDLINGYRELNPSTIEELDEEPSPLEFMRSVARNRPFVVRSAASDWTAVRKWDLPYLENVMEGQMVNVALTPSGNADSVLQTANEDETASTLFVKPYERDVDFKAASRYISRQGLNGKANVDPVCYCQTQNDNLRNEYESLFKDVPQSIPFARIALQKEPDAVNFWMGNQRSVTALHKDPYENIYVQVRGQKHFVLLPPVEAACINECLHPAATYTPSKPDEELTLDMSLSPRRDEPAAKVPFAMWDPDNPTRNTTLFSHLSRPLRITLNPGDMLYLPSLWYHKVSQSCSEEGVCIAVNYWYDMEYSGSFYPLSTFARKMGLIATNSDAAHHTEDVEEDEVP